MILALLFYVSKYTDLEINRESIKQKAEGLIQNSDYWQKRDFQFKFSSFFSGNIPEIDPVVARIVKLK